MIPEIIAGHISAPISFSSKSPLMKPVNIREDFWDCNKALKKKKK